jgi:hypothetical protein
MMDIYLRNLQYKYWLSPRGMGIDCHRTWEALYLNRVPIIPDSILRPLYEHLPVVIVEDYSQLTPLLLDTVWTDITQKRDANEYDFSSLRFESWARKILLKSPLHSKLIDESKPGIELSEIERQRPPRCWGPRQE